MAVDKACVSGRRIFNTGPSFREKKFKVRECACCCGALHACLKTHSNEFGATLLYCPALHDRSGKCLFRLGRLLAHISTAAPAAVSPRGGPAAADPAGPLLAVVLGNDDSERLPAGNR